MIKLQEDLYIPENFAEDHSYYADENKEKAYTGITTVLAIKSKPALIPWAAKMVIEWIKGNCEIEPEHGRYMVSADELETAKSAHSKKKEAAGTHGTDAHALVETYINDCIKENEGRPLVTATYDTVIHNFIRWSLLEVDHFLYAERPVHSKTMWLAGTIDFGAVMKDKSRRVGDLKTGSGIYYEAILQTEFYQMLGEEEGDEKYDGSIIVNMKKDGGFETQIRVRSEIDKQAALGALALYRGDKSFITKR